MNLKEINLGNFISTYHIFFRPGKAICLWALCLVLTAIAGCAKHPASHTTEAVPGKISASGLEFAKDQFLEDYDALWDALEEDYIYFPVLEEKGISIDSLKETTREQLKDRITDIEGFYDLLNSMFGKMEYFAHLSVLEPGIFKFYQKFYDSQKAGSNGWQRSMENPQTQAVYEYLSRDMDASASGADAFPEVEGSYDEGRRAVTFVIRTFDDSVRGRDENFMSEYFASLGNVEIDHIIFDISGNGGGSDFYWRDNIVAPFGGDYEWTDWWYLRDTKLTRDYFFDELKPEPVSRISDHNLPAFVEELGLTHYAGLQREIKADAILEGTALDAKRWVIIDGQVYSSADSFSAFCKATGWATLVGQQTRGDGQGTSPVLISLPNTGLLVRFSGFAAETPEGGLAAAVGITPDILISPAKENSRDALNRLIDDTD